MPDWLRWFIVLPTALAAYFGVQASVGVQSETWPLPDVLQDWLSQAINTVVGPWMFVYAGSAVAPRKSAASATIVLAATFVFSPRPSMPARACVST